MKLLVCDPQSQAPRVIPDSALGRNKLPWFLPDFGENWHGTVALGFRVSRLGKGIASKFADRYVDAMTLIWLPKGAGHRYADFMDGAAVVGEWIPLKEDFTVLDKEFNLVSLGWREKLAWITEAATVKNGDILAFTLPITAEKIQINQHIEFTMKGTKVLSFNVK